MRAFLCNRYTRSGGFDFGASTGDYPWMQRAQYRWGRCNRGKLTHLQNIIIDIGDHYCSFAFMFTDILLIIGQVNPLYDQSGGTALMAANILFEMLCVLPGVKYLDFSRMNWNTFHF